MSFKVLKAGILATLQDFGRFGFADRGLSQSGPADEHAYHWANHLLSNAFNATVVEITLGNIAWQALDDMQIAICGADCQFTIDGQAIPIWQTVTIKQGQTLSCKTATSGLRTYVAVKGGFQAECLFGSCSTNLREQIGRASQIGDILKTSPIGQTHVIERSVPVFYQPNYQQVLTLRLLPTYQHDQFSQQQLSTLLEQHYRIDTASDRVGYRLQGKAIEQVPARFLSEGMAYGSVEITTAGLPIILLKDRPTVGGYPKVGTVFSLDLSALTQRQMATEVRFKLMKLAEAQSERRQFNRFFNINY